MVLEAIVQKKIIYFLTKNQIWKKTIKILFSKDSENLITKCY